MALTQYNDWEPVLDPVNGKMQQEPRILAHSAAGITVGAINDTDANHGIRIVNPGNTYSVGDEITLTTNGGATAAAIIVVDAISGAPGSGAVTDYHIKSTNLGAGYDLAPAAGGLQQDSGAGSLDVEITNIDIPNTQKRGCCLYVGVAMDISMVLEGDEQDVNFKGITAGSFLPVLAKRITVQSAGTDGDIIALY